MPLRHRFFLVAYDSVVEKFLKNHAKLVKSFELVVVFYTNYSKLTINNQSNNLHNLKLTFTTAYICLAKWVMGQFCVFLLEKWTRKWRFSGQKRKFWDSFAFFSQTTINDNKIISH